MFVDGGGELKYMGSRVDKKCFPGVGEGGGGVTYLFLEQP